MPLVMLLVVFPATHVVFVDLNARGAFAPADFDLTACGAFAPADFDLVPDVADIGSSSSPSPLGGEGRQYNGKTLCQKSCAGKPSVRIPYSMAMTSASAVLWETADWVLLMAHNGAKVLGPTRAIYNPVVDFEPRRSPAKSESV